MIPNRRSTFAAYLLVFILMCDQLTKWLVVNLLEHMERPRMAVTPFLNFVLLYNKGVTFGLLNEMGPRFMPWILCGTALLILILLGRWLLRTSSTLVALSLGAIMGGAIGNLADRLRFGGVVDFIDFYYRDYHWYAFNIADAAIVTGVTLLVLESLVRGK